MKINNNSTLKHNTVIIALGSNINVSINIPLAIESISKLGTITNQTDCIVTTALNTPPGTKDYTNCALLLKTKLSLYEFIQQLKTIEDQQGRIRSTINYHPVSIDLDVTTFNGVIVDRDFDKLPFLQDFVSELQPELVNKSQ